MRQHILILGTAVLVALPHVELQAQDDSFDINSIRRELKANQDDMQGDGFVELKSDFEKEQESINAQKEELDTTALIPEDQLEVVDNDGAVEINAQEAAIREAEILKKLQETADLEDSLSEQAARAGLRNEKADEPIALGLDPAQEARNENNRVAQDKLKTLKASNSSLNTRLRGKDREISKLRAELQKVKRQLTFAETEVERLSEELRKRDRAQLDQLRGRPTRPTTATPRTATAAAVARRQQQQPRTRPNRNETQVATVAVKKANLRSGPGLSNSVLMTVPKGTRLVIETRKGDWYRVSGPNGERVWVASSVVEFGKSGTMSPSGTVQVKGYRSRNDR